MLAFRVRALRRALWASTLIPLVGLVLLLGQEAGLSIPKRTWLNSVLLAMAAIPTTLHLLSAAAGRPWIEIERDWNGLQAWQRLISSVVALACGLTTGAAVVLIVLAVAEFDAEATEEDPRPEPASRH